MKNKNFTAKQKMGLLVLLALVLFGFKKKAVPTVEIGEGEFHDFDTDGDLDDVKTSDFNPGFSRIVPETKPKYDDTGLKHNITIKAHTDECCA